MTICLIVPPSPFLLDERVFMSLGILKVAAVLEQHGIDVHVLDLSGIANCADVISDYCAAAAPSAFGITSTTPQLPATMKIVRTIRMFQPDSKIILGGPHATLVNAARKHEESRGFRGRACSSFQQLTEQFDVIVAGDGEEAIFQAIEPNAPKLIDADIPKMRLFLTNRRLEELPLPARHLVDVESYHYSIDGIRALSIIAQLGCPFECGFCGGRESPSLRRIRTRSSSHVVAEMLQLYRDYGIRGFMIYDDELNVNRQMIELMNLITEVQRHLGVEFRLRGFIKSELFTDEQAAAMYRAGFRWILVGFESGSPRILENINKKASREDNTRCIEIARRHGLKVKALMSIGHPGESAETIEETRRWLIRVKPDDFDATIITTYPGTPYYDYATRDGNGIWVYTYGKTRDRLYGIEVDYGQVADYYKGDPEGGYQSFVYTDHLDRNELVAQRDFVERDVRERLGIKFNPATSALRYEHSMGQTNLPAYIFHASSTRR